MIYIANGSELSQVAYLLFGDHIICCYTCTKTSEGNNVPVLADLLLLLESVSLLPNPESLLWSPSVTEKDVFLSSYVH